MSANNFNVRSLLQRSLILLIISIFTFQIFAFGRAQAITEEQKRLYRLGINYYDLAACGALATDTTEEAPSETSDDLKDLATRMLQEGNITYWTNNGVNTRDVVKALSEGKKAYTTSPEAASKEVDLNPNILKFILEASKDGRIMVNALTDKDHSSNSNHYKGLAVDLDSASQNTAIPVGKLQSIASKFGGKKNGESGHHHFDFTERPAGSKTGNGGEGGPEDGNVKKGVYMLGDSISLASREELADRFRAKSLDFYLNASVSRSITGKGTTSGNKTSGLAAVDEDKKRIENASAVIVALGTNQNDDFPKTMRQLTDKIKSINGDATIYWVNVFSEGKGSNKVDKERINKDIQEVAKDQGLSVIDTVEQEIELGDDKVHPTPKGEKAFAEAVSVGIESERSVDSSADNSSICECNGEQFDAGAALRGAENAEKIWNFFIDQGFKPFQVAGIMGNIQVESGFNPRALQPSTTGDAPVPGQGYGLVQWTDSGRHENLIRRSKEKKVKIYDLAFQLDHIMWELKGSEKAAYEDLKKTTNIDEAWRSFSHKYERPAVPDNPERGKAARDAMAKFGGGGGDTGSTTSPDEGSCSDISDEGSSSGQVTGKYSLPVARKFYKQHKEWFTKPHHGRNPASDIPVPSGTPVYSMTDGKVIQAPTSGACGVGIIIMSEGGYEYTYCHGTDGGSIKNAKQGDTVKAGQRIMTSGNTGSSTGPHLHVQIRVDGQLKCPQKLFESIADGSPKSEKTLSSLGCNSGGP